MRRTKGFTGKEIQRLKNIIYEKTGYRIRSNMLLLQAFTRSSFSAEYGTESNENLEFIGDQVLNYYTVKLVWERCSAWNSNYEYTIRVRTDRLHTVKNEFVNNEALSKIMEDWAVVEYMIVGESDFHNEVDKQIKVKADLLEAILGAIAVDCKWDSTVLERVVSQILGIDQKIDALIATEYRRPEFKLENAVNTLKELAEHGMCSVPKYDIVGPEYLGYDKDGNPNWVCTCSMVNDRTGIVRQVRGPSKKTVKKYAAYLVLCEHFEMQNEYGSNRSIGFRYKDGMLIPE